MRTTKPRFPVSTPVSPNELIHGPGDFARLRVGIDGLGQERLELGLARGSGLRATRAGDRPRTSSRPRPGLGYSFERPLIAGPLLCRLLRAGEASQVGCSRVTANEAPALLVCKPCCTSMRSSAVTPPARAMSSSSRKVGTVAVRVIVGRCRSPHLPPQCGLCNCASRGARFRCRSSCCQESSPSLVSVLGFASIDTYIQASCGADIKANTT